MNRRLLLMYGAALVVTVVGSAFFSTADGENGSQRASSDSTTVEKIAFYSGRYGNREICLVNPDGTGFQRLTSNTGHDECPSFSPDGKKIAFISDRDGNFEIYLMNPDGSDQQRITYSPEDELHTDWTPDARRSLSPAIPTNPIPISL